MALRHTTRSQEAQSQAAAGAQASVLLPLPLEGAYDYRLPPGEPLAPGSFVEAPLGARAVLGVVWGEAEGGVDEAKLREVAALPDALPMTAVARAFVDWVARYTVQPPGAVLRMMMSVPEALEPPRPIAAYMRSEVDPDADPESCGEADPDARGEADPEAKRVRLTPARRRVLAVLADGPPRPAAELAREAGVTPGVVKGLAAAGLLATVQLRPAAPPQPDPERPGPTLSADQAAAAAVLVEGVRAGGFGVNLLDGVTGSGKTEVYFEAIVAALLSGRQVLVLLPEIAMSAQWFARFAERFGVAPATWHSEMSRPERRRVWRGVAEGKAKVVVGARSALFLPYADLGLIVIDEEHDASYKQEDGVVYHARDMGVVRAQLGEIPIVLASATPSLETLVNVDDGRYRRLHLPERHGVAELPQVALVDMRRNPPPRGKWLSPALSEALQATLAAGEQAMLFLNRRGYAPLTLCRACGHRIECPRCTAWLVEHRLAGRLECHHCGHAMRPPRHCPECEAEGALVACGPGVERVAEEAAARFPEAAVAIMASDTIRGPAAAAELVRRIQDKEIDLLIGTQIMAKGHHFPLLTLVGVIDADLGLAGGDPRAAERTFQLLSQVAGRAGRAERPGRVLLQTYMPEHGVMRAMALGDRERFLAEEKAAREAAHLPPFGRLAALVISGPNPARVDETARLLALKSPRAAGVQVLGPAPAPLATLRGQHRRRFLVKAGREARLQPYIRQWLGAVKVPSGVRIKVDIDPYSFL
jgi:primosomal protein N' (replication factor Y)